jgi:hypothetical protein
MRERQSSLFDFWPECPVLQKVRKIDVYRAADLPNSHEEA